MSGILPPRARIPLELTSWPCWRRLLLSAAARSRHPKGPDARDDSSDVLEKEFVQRRPCQPHHAGEHLAQAISWLNPGRVSGEQAF